MEQAELQLPCRTIVYRLATNNNWITEEGKLIPRAFLLRGLITEQRPELERELSVFIAERCNYSLKEKYPTYYGVVSLHVGHIRNIQEEQKCANLDVLPDNELVAHASLIGLPNPTEDYPRAIYLAEELAKLSRKQEWK